MDSRVSFFLNRKTSHRLTYLPPLASKFLIWLCTIRSFSNSSSCCPSCYHLSFIPLPCTHSEWLTTYASYNSDSLYFSNSAGPSWVWDRGTRDFFLLASHHSSIRLLLLLLFQFSHFSSRSLGHHVFHAFWPLLHSLPALPRDVFPSYARRANLAPWRSSDSLRLTTQLRSIIRLSD